MNFIRRLLGLSETAPAYWMCCGQPLSEWFIDGTEGWPESWGMVCIYCHRISPWISHESFRAARAAGEEKKR